jgi:hypothetical protein
MSFIRAVAAVLVASAAVTTRTQAQSASTKAATVNASLPSVLVPFGRIKTISGQRAVAVSSDAKAVAFSIAPELQGKVGPSQLVWTNLAKSLVAYAAFPLAIPSGKNCVGEGPGKGCFRMETSEAKVSHTGLTTGKTKTISEDVISGFTGATWVQIYDKAGNPLAIRRAGCWGVNMRQGRTEAWSVQFPADTAGMAAKADVWHVQSPCDRDRWDAIMDKAKKAAEVLAAFKSTAPKDTTASTTEPKVGR